jgi:sulfite exporter TauE/SafE
MWLVAAFTMGFVGSVHCVGMCGPIVMALPVRTHSWLHKSLKYLLYHFGRLITYSLLGFVFSFIGKGFVFAGLQQFVCIVAGILMILSVFIIYRPVHFVWFDEMATGLRSRIGQYMRHYFQRAKATDFVILGMLNGILPCGMIYAALLSSVATTGNVSGSFFMFFFGLGTVPIMLLIGLMGGVIGFKWRSKLRGLTPLITIAVGILLLLRGFQVEVPLDLAGSIHNCY